MVLPDSAEAYGRGDRLALCPQVQTLSESLHVSPRHMLAWRFARQAHGVWLLAAFTEPGEDIPPASGGCVLSIADFFDQVPL